MIDAASGGDLMDKTSTVARHLISNMASNIQQFRIKGAITNKAVNELIELTSLVRQLAVSQHQQNPHVKVCGICTSVEHLTDMCPTLLETESDNVELVGAIGGYQYGRQPYPARQNDSQQFGGPQYRSSQNQGQYTVPRFGSTLSMPALNWYHYQ
ncbi:hypothetical protein CR513_34510, partial [Mucuna pruriens]